MRLLTLFFFTFFALCNLYGSHNKAGEITFEQIGPREIKAIITTYTKISADIDRQKIEINWGDGKIDSTNILPGYPQPFSTFNDLQVSVYEITHTYSGAGSFFVSFEDPFRNSGIKNIKNSDQVPLTLVSQVIISPFLGNNNSPILLNPPIENACIGRVFEHNPSAFDPDGDSLFYSLVTPKGENVLDIPDYFIPENVSLNPNNGTLTWDSPTQAGEFNFAIKIEEFRAGFKIGEVIRDMQVEVSSCDNESPIITSEINFCVLAGDTLNFEVLAKDINLGDNITLTATGGPLNSVTPQLATFPNGKSGIDSVSANFRWITNCDHIRSSAYQVSISATDNNNSTPLSSTKIINIKVIAPPLSINNPTVNNLGINIKWNKDTCNKAIRYELYRKIDSTNYLIDSCTTGIPAELEYQLINDEFLINDTSFTDISAKSGNLYCYRVIAVFPDGSKSITSKEVCTEPFNTNPIFIKNSVVVTSEINGEIELKWLKPKEINLIGNENEMNYELYEIINNQEVLIYTSNNLEDTSFVHNAINTLNSSHTYVVKVVLNNNEVSSSSSSTSVFLIGKEFNNSAQLNWIQSTPWINSSFEILIQDKDDPLNFIAIDTVFEGSSCLVNNLPNQEEACFKINSIGQYSGTIYTDSITNFSQLICVTPADNIAPCPPILNFDPNCDNNEIFLSWNYLNDTCDADILFTKIFKKSTINFEYELYQTFNGKSITNFRDFSLTNLVGCYAIVVEDTLGNQSDIEQNHCIENCYEYTLPNIFSPNGDNFNDVFIPIKNTQIEKVNFQVYNRWGNLIFETDNSNLNWDGRNMTTNLPVSGGVYFYTCIIFINTLNGTIEKNLNGFIHIIND